MIIRRIDNHWEVGHYHPPCGEVFGYTPGGHIRVEDWTWESLEKFDTREQAIAFLRHLNGGR